MKTRACPKNILVKYLRCYNFNNSFPRSEYIFYLSFPDLFILHFVEMGSVASVT